MKMNLVWIPIILLIAGCAHLDIQSGKHPKLTKNASWTLLPFVNNTQTPLANDRAAAMAAAILQADGVRLTGDLPNGARTQELFGGNWKKRYDDALSNAHNSGTDYALSGSVDEWDYKAGINAEPVVSMTLWIVDMHNDKVIWTGMASASGSSFSPTSTSHLAQRLLNRLIGRAIDQ